MTLEVQLQHRFADFAMDVAFRAPSRGITALFGPSGAGKSTIIDAVAGLLRPDGGRVVLDGRVLLDVAKRVCVPARARKVGYVFQDARLFPHLDVRANLLYGWRRSSDRLPRREIDHVVEMLGIGHLLQRRPAALSGGERQRIALGRALLARPSLLLLDEPLAGLDAARRREILPYLERMRDEARLPMLYVSHSVEEVARLADYVALLQDGRVIARGAPGEILARLDLPPVTDFEPGALLEARVAGQDDEYGLTRLALPRGELSVPALDKAIDTAVRVRIRARDIMLALDEPRRISANNVLACTVEAVQAGGGAEASVQLDCGGQTLVARITRRSLARLELRPGTAVYALIKTVVIAD